MRVLAETRAWRNAILIDDTQRAEPHVAGVVIVSKRERVPTLQPAKVSYASVVCSSYGTHLFVSSLVKTSRPNRLRPGRARKLGSIAYRNALAAVGAFFQ